MPFSEGIVTPVNTTVQVRLTFSPSLVVKFHRILNCSPITMVRVLSSFAIVFPFIGIENNVIKKQEICFNGVCSNYLGTQSNSTIFETSLKIN